MVIFEFLLKGQTEQIDNTLNPTFARSVQVPYAFERKQFYKIEAYDYDSPKKVNYIGEAEFELGALVGCPQRMIKSVLHDKKNPKNNGKNRGEVLVRYEAVGNSNNIIRLNIMGRGIFKKRMFHENKNYLAFYKSKSLVKGIDGTAGVFGNRNNNPNVNYFFY